MLSRRCSDAARTTCAPPRCPHKGTASTHAPLPPTRRKHGMNTTNHRALGACCALAVALGSSALAGCARPTAPAAPTAQSAHLDDGSIEVAKNSPLRQRLQVAPALEQDIATQTDAPGSIEAMPEKLVKITPPLAGRITRLQRSLATASRRAIRCSPSILPNSVPPTRTTARPAPRCCRRARSWSARRRCSRRRSPRARITRRRRQPTTRPAATRTPAPTSWPSTAPAGADRAGTTSCARPSPAP